MSAVGMVVGLAFVVIGFSLFIPLAGFFGVLWTLVAIAVTAYYAINVFSERGMAHEVIEFDDGSPKRVPSSPQSVERRLADLKSLRDRGVISAEEYASRRRRIIDEL